MHKTETVIYYKFGAMNSAKSADLIRLEYNYREHDYRTLVFKPAIDSRKKGMIHSRIGMSIPAIEIMTDDSSDVSQYLIHDTCDVIFCDEAQFLDPVVIDTIIEFAYKERLIVMFYGLKVDFRGHLFPGTKRILEVADKIEEATSIC